MVIAHFTVCLVINGSLLVHATTGSGSFPITALSFCDGCAQLSRLRDDTHSDLPKFAPWCDPEGKPGNTSESSWRIKTKSRVVLRMNGILRRTFFLQAGGMARTHFHFLIFLMTGFKRLGTRRERSNEKKTMGHLATTTATTQRDGNTGFPAISFTPTLTMDLINWLFCFNAVFNRTAPGQGSVKLSSS